MPHRPSSPSRHPPAAKTSPENAEAKRGPTPQSKDKEDSADAVLDEIAARQATRLVIGMKRRTPVGKAILGSLSQRLLLNSPVPVLAVKLPEDEWPSSSFDNLPAGMRRVTG